MQLWRRRAGRALTLGCDDACTVASQIEWARAVDDPTLISSVLWSQAPVFPVTGPHFHRAHPHERARQTSLSSRCSYREGCDRLAARLAREWSGARCLVYAPLRGALPLWRAVRTRLPSEPWDVYHPVTSSFVFHQPGSPYRNRKGRLPSGRYNNVLELQRLEALLDAYDVFVYLDEIVSGGAMVSHLADMMECRVAARLPIVAAGLADRDGERSRIKRAWIDHQCAAGTIRQFVWEGCEELTTEDHKFLLGVHYVHYDRGLHVVPVLRADGTEHEEKTVFDSAVIEPGGGHSSRPPAGLPEPAGGSAPPTP